MSRTRLAWLPLLPLLLGAGGEAVEVRLTVHVAKEAITQADLTVMTDRLGELYAGTVTFAITVVPWPEGPAAIVTVDDRDALAARVSSDGSVHIFVIAEVADKDKSGDWLGGVVWRYAGGKKAWLGRRYVILSATGARVDTLGHELGHYFGLDHGDQATDLMNQYRDPGAKLSEAQLRKVRRRARAQR
jgi:hypothetical protein